jgi:hypothetical protein
MELVCQFSRTPLTPEDIAQFETAHKLTIPESFRSFLLKHNGAVFQFDYPAFRVKNERVKEALLQCFFCLSDGDPIDMKRVYRVHRKRLPEELMPIGSDPGNNLICLGIKGDHLGKLYFWERTKEHSPPTFANVYWLADDFESFLQGLYPFEG